MPTILYNVGIKGTKKSMNKELVLEIAKNNNGYIYSNIIKENNIPTIYLTRLVKEGNLKKIYRGIYIINGIIEDPFFVKSVVYSKLVYSGKTALYLNNLSNQQFDEYEATIPYESHIPKIAGFRITQSRKSAFSLGVDLIETPYGNKVKCYNKERCICNLFIENDFDYEDKVYAINEYKKNYLNIKKLYEYAKNLKVLDKVRNVFEVIAWN